MKTMSKRRWLAWLLLALAAMATAILVGAPTSQAKVTNHQLAQRVKKMTLRQKIGQMYLAPAVDQQTAIKAEQEYQLGGWLLFGSDFAGESKDGFVAKLKAEQAASKLPLLIATDQEGGSVSRLDANPAIGGSSHPSPQDLLKAGGEKQLVKQTGATAKQLRQLGINWNLAPVADVTSDQQSFIYDRTLGLPAKQAAPLVAKEVKAIQGQRVAASLKHFPGYGSAPDTHTGTGTSNQSLATYQQQEWLPFKAGIKAGADSVLVAHVVMTAVDPNLPASLSPKVHRLLRRDLHFRGVIVTDDLSMGAITKFAQQSKQPVDVLAVKAGNDMLIASDYATGIDQVVAAVKQGEIKESQINQSVLRILKLKRKLGLLK